MTIDNSKWRMKVAKLMLNWKDLMVECERTILSPVFVTDNHCPKPVSKSSNVCIWCVVCGLKTSIHNSIGIQLMHMATCISPNCDIVAYSHVS